MKNIILIGMPGAGKSTIGVVLAKRIGYRFVDSDLVIQEKKGMLLWQIIEEKGIDGFLKVENDINASLRMDKSVIATGGSAIYGSDAMAHFKQTGIVIYLRLPFTSIAERLDNLAERGVTMQKGETLEELYAERRPYYEKYADIVIECEGKSIREITAEIIADIRKRE